MLSRNPERKRGLFPASLPPAMTLQATLVSCSEVKPFLCIFQVLVMGLIGSLSSIFYVALLLMLVFYLYGIMCVSFFRDNDPVHFGSLETAFLTLFRMSTFEDWTDVMYTQLYGCDVYPYHFRWA